MLCLQRARARLPQHSTAAAVSALLIPLRSSFATAAAASPPPPPAAGAAPPAEAKFTPRGKPQSTEWGPNSRSVIPSLRRSVPRQTPFRPPIPVHRTRLPDDKPDDKTKQCELHAAVIVERWPKIMREEPSWRTEYHAHFAELRHKKHPIHDIPPLLQSKKEEPTGAAAHVDPNDLLTEADRANDLHATHRCLQDSLFLVVKRRGSSGGWAFPSAVVPFDINGWDTHAPILPADASKLLAATSVKEFSAMLAPPPPPKDTLRSVAAQAVSANLGTHASIYFMGNAPIAVHRVLKPMATPSLVGTKTFFMHALYMDGEVRLQNPKELEDYAWVKRDQLEKYVGKELAELLQPILLDADA